MKLSVTCAAAALGLAPTALVAGQACQGLVLEPNLCASKDRHACFREQNEIQDIMGCVMTDRYGGQYLCNTKKYPGKYTLTEKTDSDSRPDCVQPQEVITNASTDPHCRGCAIFGHFFKCGTVNQNYFECVCSLQNSIFKSHWHCLAGCFKQPPHASIKYSPNCRSLFKTKREADALLDGPQPAQEEAVRFTRQQDHGGSVEHDDGAAVTTPNNLDPVPRAAAVKRSGDGSNYDDEDNAEYSISPIIVSWILSRATKVLAELVCIFSFY